MAQIFNNDIGKFIRKVSPIQLEFGRITLSQARKMAALTEYTTREDGLKEITAGVPVGPWGNVLEACDVASVEALAEFYAFNEIATECPTLDGDAIIFEPYIPDEI